MFSDSKNEQTYFHDQKSYQRNINEAKKKEMEQTRIHSSWGIVGMFEVLDVSPEDPGGCGEGEEVGYWILAIG